MTITEPATLVTDYLLALFTGALGRRLGSLASDAEMLGFTDKARAQRWWSVAFLATAVAGAAGGTVHGFQRGDASGGDQPPLADHAREPGPGRVRGRQRRDHPRRMELEGPGSSRRLRREWRLEATACG